MQRLMITALMYFVIPLTVAAQVNLKPTTPILPLSSLGAEEIQISFNNFCEYPDLAVDNNGIVWAAYTEYLNEKENIILKKIDGMKITDSIVVNSISEGNEYYPRLFCDAKNKLWIVWSAKRNNRWDIFIRNYWKGNLSEEINLTNNDAVDLHPSVCVDESSNLWIAWESMNNNNFEILAVKISEEEVVSAPINVSSSPNMDLRPTIFCSGNNVSVVWDQQEEDKYQTFIKTITGNDQQEALSPAKGFNMAASAAYSNNGDLFTAWHSNLQPDGEAGYTPWIYFKNAGGSTYTTALEGDWLKVGEDQALEFPSLIINDGVQWIFTRASQSFYVQAIKEDSASVLYKFEVEGWGGRGQNVRPFLSEDGFIYSIRRDINYIYLNRFNPGAAQIKYSHKILKAEFEHLDEKAVAPHHAAENVELKSLGHNQIVFGDIHQHSALSDGRGTVDECFTRSKFIYRHDFAALSDHEWFTGNLLIPSEWELIKIMGQYFYEPGKFITFAAYEWTTPRVPKGFGHKNVYFSGWDKPIFSFKFDASSTKDLFQLLKENDAIAFPHHIGWTGIDWENHDEEAQPDIEMISAHGAFEYMGNEPIRHRGGMPGNFIQDGLAKGLKFGLIGSSDGHGLRWHHGIARKEDEWQTGLTGAIVPEKTKDNIFNALKTRRVYATSGSRIRTILKVNDQWMGSDISTAAFPKIDIEVIGTAQIDYAVLLKDNEEILHLGRDWYDGFGIIYSYVDEKITEGEHFYYLRVVQSDGEMSWSSPVWVNYQP